MDAYNRISFEVKKEDRVYRFDIPNNAPMGEAYEAVGKFMDKMIELINQHRAQVEEKPLEDNAEVKCDQDV